jgi:4-amino-4-deoxy-L-arabinose transferase-like glycosyltransferase
MNTQANMPPTPNSNKWEYLFFAVFTTYMVGQYLLLNRILLYFPGGFETENFYSPIAVHIAKDGFQGILNYLGGEMPPGMPYGPAFRPPLYPITLAVLYLITSANEFNALILNNIFLSLAIFLTYLTGRRFSQRTGFIAAFLLMLDIILISEANSTHSDGLFFILVTTAHFFFVRYLFSPEGVVNILASAIAISLALLTRNIGLYFVPIMLIILVVSRWRQEHFARSITIAALFSLIIGSTIGAWIWRNYEITGDPAFASGNMAVHLNHYYLPHVYALRDRTSFDEARQKVKTEFEAIPGFGDLPPEARDKVKVQFAIKTIIGNAHWAAFTLLDQAPKVLLSYPFEVLATLANRDQIENWRKFDETEFLKRYQRPNFDISAKYQVFRFYVDNGMTVSASYGVFNKLVNGMSFIAALIGVFLLVRKCNPAQRALGWFLFLQCFLILGISSLTPSARFRVPLMPLISIAAAFALEQVLTWMGRYQVPGTR